MLKGSSIVCHVGETASHKPKVKFNFRFIGCNCFGFWLRLLVFDEA
jgi:hypothetical protein